MINILFVDDEIDMLKQAEIYLSKQNGSFEIETALSGEEALDLLSKKNFDIIITDYKMPSMDGIELLKEVRESEIDIPFIILTAAGDEEVAMDALNYGADRYILKEGRVKKQFQILSKEIKQEIEHYNTRKKLIKSESKYENLVNNLPVGIYKTNPKGEIINANKAFSEMLGYSSVRELKAINAFDLFVDPEDRNEWMEKIRKNDIVENFEFKMKKHDGTVIWVEDTARVVKDEEGNIHHFNGIIRDITELKEIEEELGQSKEWLSLTFNILDSLDDPIITTDRKGRIAFINNSTENFFGFNKNAIIGDDFKDHLKLFYRDSEKRVDKPIDKLLNGDDEFLNNRLLDIETKEDKRTVLCTGNYIKKKSGNIIGTIFTFKKYIDLPKLGKRDKSPNSLPDDIPVGLVILDSDYIPVQINNTALEYIGYKGIDLKNTSVFKWPVEKNSKFTYDNLNESLEKEGYFETRVIKKDNDSEKIFSFKMKKKEDLDSKIFLSIYDITVEVEEMERINRKSSKYRKAYNSIDESIVIGKLIFNRSGKPNDFKILDTNSAFQNMMGIKRDEVIGKNWSEILFDLEQDDLKKIDKAIKTDSVTSFKLVNNRTKNKIDVKVVSEKNGRVLLILKEPY